MFTWTTAIKTKVVVVLLEAADVLQLVCYLKHSPEAQFGTLHYFISFLEKSRNFNIIHIFCHVINTSHSNWHKKYIHAVKIWWPLLTCSSSCSFLFWPTPNSSWFLWVIYSWCQEGHLAEIVSLMQKNPLLQVITSESLSKRIWRCCRCFEGWDL